MNLQILSAGLGLRLRPVTEKIPKPALPILNVPMLFYSLHYFREKNFQNIVVNTFHLEKILRNEISKLESDIKFISDGNELLGTGGGIENASAYLRGNDYFWIANGDCLFLSDDDFVSSAEKNHKLKKPIATLVVMDHPGVGTKFGGVWVDQEDQVLAIGKTRPAGAVKGYHFTGFRILSDEIFKYLPKGPSELFDSLMIAMSKGQSVQIYKTKGHFFETGNEKDFIDCTKTLLKFLEEKKYSKFLNSLLEKYSSKSRLNDFSTDLKLPPHENLKYLFVDENFKLFNESELEGFIVAGSNVIIKEKCHLKNVVILNNQVIPENSDIENKIIL